jgi:hypothetical protein
VVTRENIRDLGGLGTFLAGYQGRYANLHAWHLYRMLPVGRGGAVHGESLGIGLDEYRTACNAVRADQPGLRILKRPDMLHSATVGFFWLQGGRLRSRSPYALPSILLPEFAP